MSSFKTITLTHANLKRPVHMMLGQIAFFNISNVDGVTWTNVFTNGGICPVVETPEAITQLIQQATAQTPAKSSAPHAGPLTVVPPESKG